MRGKVTFEAAGKEYALRFTTNRLCQLEQDSGQTVLALCAKLEEPENVKFGDLRMIFRAGLDGTHTLDQAGDILDEIGLQRGLMLAAQAMSAAFDIDTDGGEASGGKPKAGAA